MTGHAADAAPARGVELKTPNGLGVPSAPARDPFSVWSKIQRTHVVEGRQWFSPIAYFLGPFDGANALVGAADFYRQTHLSGPPQVYLTATEVGLGIIPTSNWMMRLVRGTQETLFLTYDSLESIELRPASRSRMSTMIPRTSHKLGQVVVTTKDARTGTLSGTTVDSLHAFLLALGARPSA